MWSCVQEQRNMYAHILIAAFVRTTNALADTIEASLLLSASADDTHTCVSDPSCPSTDIAVVL